MRPACSSISTPAIPRGSLQARPILRRAGPYTISLSRRSRGSLAYSARWEEALQIERALPFTWEFQGYSPVFDKFEAVDTGGETAARPPPMKLKSVNVSMPKDVAHNGKVVTTGIFKEPVEGRVMLRRLNLDGDGEADLWGHGGAFRAVYAYAFENYAYWAGELGRDDFTIGQFGENFTVEGMLEDDVHVGCQTAFNIDPRSACKIDPPERHGGGCPGSQ